MYQIRTPKTKTKISTQRIFICPRVTKRQREEIEDDEEGKENKGEMVGVFVLGVGADTQRTTSG